MPYVTCPDCGLTAHFATNGEHPIGCPRCSAAQLRVEPLQAEEPLRGIIGPPKNDPAAKGK